MDVQPPSAQEGAHTDKYTHQDPCMGHYAL